MFRQVLFVFFNGSLSGIAIALAFFVIVMLTGNTFHILPASASFTNHHQTAQQEEPLTTAER